MVPLKCFWPFQITETRRPTKEVGTCRLYDGRARGGEGVAFFSSSDSSSEEDNKLIAVSTCDIGYTKDHKERVVTQLGVDKNNLINSVPYFD